MSGMDMILNTAKKGLFVAQTSIQVAGHNIANVNTPGYDRQRTVLAQDKAFRAKPGMMGTGVVATEIKRVYDRFIAEQINRNEKLAGKWKGMADAFSSIEGIFNETSGYGLNSTLNEFWNAWQDLSNNPEAQAGRANLVVKGESLAFNVRQINADVAQSRKDLNAKIESLVVEINSISSQISEINDKVAFIQASGESPNDMLGQRDRLLRELSAKLDINYFVGDDGKVTVFMARNGLPLVENITASHLSLETNAEGLYDIVLEGVNTTTAITQGDGELGGLLKVRDADVPEYLQRINALAEALIFEVNAVHSNGVGLDLFDGAITGANQSSDGTLGGLDYGSRINFSGTEFTIWVRNDAAGTTQGVTIDMSPFTQSSTLNDLVNDPTNGINRKLADAGLGGILSASVAGNALRFQVAGGNSFGFSGDTSHILAALGINTFFAGHNAQDMSLNAYLSDHPEAIASARIDGTTGAFAAGDNSNARVIAELQNQPLLSGQRETFDQYYASLVGDIGVKVKDIDQNLNHQTMLLDQLNTQRESVSGVSIDEEMISLMKFQQAYMASAKVISQIEELIDILMNMLK